MSGPDYRAAEIAIVGGGIIGCAIAYELARKGHDVAVIERGAIGREASGASAGVIGPPSQTDLPPVRVELTARSLAAYPWLVAALQEETGLDVGYRQWGTLLVARDERELARLRALLSWQEELGFDSEWVDAAELRELEPTLPAGLRGALLANDGGSVHVYRLTRALAAAAARRGARLIEHTPALGLTTRGARVTGVRLPAGSLPAAQVVLAAGAWTAGLGQALGRPLPTIPVKGQMLAIGGVLHPPQHVIGGAGGYLVSRTDGTVAVAATEEYVGFDTRVTPAGLQTLVGLVAALGPGLLQGEVIATWAGLRPGSADGEAIVGPVPGYDNLWVASGHHRTGVQLAIGTAEVLVASLLAGAPDPLLAPLSPARFAAPPR
ncbi:MAG: glycine oxidase ThiO [Sphaerobacter sp.]|nr:glycine oxidase ThiO [Sphaerobacter sp.]